MRHTAAVYGRSLLAHLRSTLEYPADFWIMASAGAIWQVLQFAFLSVLFLNITSLAGWSYYEMLLLVGFLGLTGGASSLLWDGVWSLPALIVKGDMDYRIIRPAPVVAQVASLHIGMQSFGEFTLSLAMVAFGWFGAGIPLTALPVAVLAAVCALVIQCALMTASCALNFWVKGHFPAFAFVTADLQQEVMRFPLAIYPTLVRAVVTFVLPFAFASFIPVQVLLGRISEWWLIGPPVAAAVTVALAALVFRLGLRSYDSAGH